MSFGYFSPANRAGCVLNWAPRSRRPSQAVGGAHNVLPELLGDIVRFCRTAKEDLDANRLVGLSLGAYLRREPESLQPLPEWRVGEVWVRGPQVADGFADIQRKDPTLLLPARLP
jgi:hypothetical protein